MDIIELTFDKIEYGKGLKLIALCAKKWGIQNINSSVNSDDCMLPLEDLTISNLLDDSTGTIYSTFNKIDFLKNDIFDLGINILKYGTESELNIHIEVEYIKKFSLLEITKVCRKIANFLQTNEYYCGFEPAIDEDTQFFSSSKIGPVPWF